MLLRVTIAEKTDFVPSLKVDGEFYQAPKTLHNGDSLEVKDFIGYALLAHYKGAFEVLQHEPIKDGIDNTITKDDVIPKEKRKRITKDIKASHLSQAEAAHKTAAEFSAVAAERIESLKPDAAGDKLALEKNAPKPGDGHDAGPVTQKIEVTIPAAAPAKK